MTSPAADAWAECRRGIARHSKSFDLASRLLPRGRRDEVAALYGWCRLCDDAIDLAPAAEQDAALAALRGRLDSVYSGVPQADAVSICFQEVVRRRGIPREYPAELLEGMAMDVRGARYATLDELLVYCWRVAGTVGLMMCHVMGVTDDRAAPHAAHLGIAMQLTNIARDVAEDWARGRCYLPDALLAPPLRAWTHDHRSDATRLPLPESARGDLAAAVRELLLVAEGYYGSADAGLGYLEPRCALAVRTARLVYAEIGRRLEARACDVLQGRAVVPAGRKLALAARALGVFAADRHSWRAPELIAPRHVLACGDAVRLA